jgi:hypothetical protein
MEREGDLPFEILHRWYLAFMLNWSSAAKSLGLDVQDNPAASFGEENSAHP